MARVNWSIAWSGLFCLWYAWARSLESLPSPVVEPDCRLEIRFGLVPLAALEPEQPAAGEQDVPQVLVGSSVQELEGPPVVGLGRLELELDLGAQCAAPGLQALGGRAGQAGDLIRDEPA